MPTVVVQRGTLSGTRRGIKCTEKKLTDTMQRPVDFCLAKQLRVLCFNRLEFDRNFLASRHIGSKVDVTKRAAANFAAQPVLLADTQFLKER